MSRGTTDGRRDPHGWAVILAAGQGRRLAGLTRALHDDGRPKQFALLHGNRSPLQVTVERVLGLVDEDHLVVIVAEDRWDLARDQLAAWPAVEIVSQPLDRGTGPGLLLPLARVLARDPAAHVAVFPSDHHIPRPRPFIETVRRASEGACAHGGRVTLVGAEPDRPETDYGWIVPGPQNNSHLAAVERFVEKPAEDEARRLLGAGALWNTFVLVGCGRVLWEMAARHLPEQVRLLAEYADRIAAGDGQSLADLYARLPTADFSRDVLQLAARDLAVARLDACGWSDWGAPERVFQSLAGTFDLADLLGRIGPKRAPTSGEPGGADVKEFALAVQG